MRRAPVDGKGADKRNDGRPSCQTKFENCKNFEISLSSQLSPISCQAWGTGMRVETPEIFVDLQRKLMTAELRPGTKLKPAELQGFYGCSANTVRDVLLRLSKVGLVEFEMQRGFRVRDTTPERRHDVTRFRILLEQEGARL
ncbi:unnamed protein product, partial [Ectocarpus sp. 12 AP-2014]